MDPEHCFKLEAAASEARNKKKFLLIQSCRSLEHGPRSDKKIKNSEQFFKCIHTERKKFSCILLF